MKDSYEFLEGMWDCQLSTAHGTRGSQKVNTLKVLLDRDYTIPGLIAISFTMQVPRQHCKDLTIDEEVH
jgi:hypothetical protein